jgi:hypothetical protein
MGAKSEEDEKGQATRWWQIRAELHDFEVEGERPVINW